MTTRRSRATKREAVAVETDDEAEDVEVVQKPAKQKRRSNGNVATGTKRFKLFSYPGDASRTFPDPFVSGRDFEADVKSKEMEKAEMLAADELKKLVGKMVRYLLMRGTKKLPINKSKLNNAVMGDYKKAGILNFVLAEAQKLLRAIWGFDVVPAPASAGADKFFKGGAYKDAMYVVCDHKLRAAAHHELATEHLSEAEQSQRAFLLVVLSFVQSDDGAIRETELYRLLNKLDPVISDEPPGKGKGALVPNLGNIPALLETFVAQHYLVKDRDGEDHVSFGLGPRALVDVGRYQVAQFQADSLSQTIDAAILKELEDEDPEEEGEEEPSQPSQQ